ncbi:hypothetical protein [Corallibacter sp.]|uniref:hypothetical protein n=1 Tax=Corallibacter sp. TaxID=2038084 RepID=UPI003AB8FE48
MKKVIILFTLLSTFIFGTNTVYGQQITKKDIQTVTIEILNEEENPAVKEVKVIKENLYWRVRTLEGKNFLVVLPVKDYHESDFSRIEIIQRKNVSLLQNYIKSYFIAKQKKVEKKE